MNENNNELDNVSKNVDQTNSETITEEKTEPKKKGKGGVIAAIIAVIILVIAGVICFLFLGTTIFLSPKQKVMLAFSKAGGADNIISILSGNKKVKSAGNFAPRTGLGLKEYADIKESIDEKGIQASFELKLKKIKSDDYKDLSKAQGSAFSVDYMLDKNNRQAYYNLYLKFMAIKLLNAEVFVDDADVSLALKDYFDGYFTLNTENFTKDFKKSPLYEEYYDDEMPNISFNIFDLMDKSIELQPDYSIFLDEAGDSIKIMKELYDSVDVEETGASEKFDIGGKDIACKEYEVTIKEKALSKFEDKYKDFLYDLIIEYYENYFDYLENDMNIDDEVLDDLRDDFFEDFDEEYDEFFEAFEEYYLRDYTFYVYLDNKCRLIDFFYEDSFETDYETINLALDMTWHGKDYLFDAFDGSLIIKDEDEENSIEIYFANDGESNNEGRHDEFTAEFIVNDYGDEEKAILTVISDKKETGEFSYEGKLEHPSDKQYISYLAEGKISADKDFYEVNIDNLTFDLNLDERNTVTLEAFYSIGSLYDEIPAPKGPKYEIFKMDEDDFEDVIDEIEENFEDIWGNLF